MIIFIGLQTLQEFRRDHIKMDAIFLKDEELLIQDSRKKLQPEVLTKVP